MNKRTTYKDIWDRLLPDKSLILLAGPRQSGKTTFARGFAAKDFNDVIYFNWDIGSDKRKHITDPEFFSKVPKSSISSKPFVILDQIHKYRDWKNYVKGIYDKFEKEYKFLATGSGRLEYSRKAGDSLAGRHLKFHIFPFTLSALGSPKKGLEDFLKNPLEDFEDTASVSTADNFHNLWELSRFPEPFLKGKKKFGLHGPSHMDSKLSGMILQHLRIYATLIWWKHYLPLSLQG